MEAPAVSEYRNGFEREVEGGIVIFEDSQWYFYPSEVQRVNYPGEIFDVYAFVRIPFDPNTGEEGVPEFQYMDNI